MKKIKTDYSHIWGEYKELLLSNELIIRTIRFYKWWKTSLHSHSVEETIIVEHGEILVELENDNWIIEKLYFKEWDSFIIKPHQKHRTGCVSWLIINNIESALVTEIVIWDNKTWKYEIFRHEPSIFIK